MAHREFHEKEVEGLRCQLKEEWEAQVRRCTHTCSAATLRVSASVLACCLQRLLLV